MKKKQKMQRYRRNSEAYEMSRYWLNERIIVACPGLCGICIEWICYDVQCEMLGIKLKEEEEWRCYFNVPEKIWYGIHTSTRPDVYYRRCICGCYPERIQKAGSNTQGSDKKS